MGNKPIVHAPIATGSTEPRDIRDRFADFVNLKDFGAVGDGVTDDTSAWTAWRTAFINNGGTCFIPKGDYLLGNEIIRVPKGHINAPYDINITINENGQDEDGNPVLDTFYAQIYVDGTNGLDTNDGLSFTTAVKTINEALKRLQSMPKSQENIPFLHIKAGTYVENVDISSINVVFVLYGEVTIQGQFRVMFKGYCFIKQSPNTTGKFIVKYTGTNNSGTAVYVANTSVLWVRGQLEIWANSCYVAIGVYQFSWFKADSNTTAIKVKSLSGSVIDIWEYGWCQLGDTTIQPIDNGDTTPAGVRLGRLGCLLLDSLVSTISFTNAGISSLNFSYVRIGGNCDLPGQGVLWANNNSIIAITNFSYCKLGRTSPGYDTVGCSTNSYIELSSEVSNSYIQVTSSNSKSGCVFHAYCFGYIQTKAPYIKIIGSSGSVYQANMFGYITIPYSVSFNGSNATANYRASAYNFGFIANNGGGYNRIPGSSSNYTDTYGVISG